MQCNKLTTVYYHPTQVALIDDNSSFLHNFELQLKIKKIATKAFSAQEEFLSYFQKSPSNQQTLGKFLSWLDEDDFDHRTLDIDLAKISQLRLNKERTEIITVVISDYAMPGMDGLELLGKITAEGVKKILLTGEADEKIAVQAFNNNLIDAFIRKDDLDFNETVVATIQQLQLEYFAEMSKLVLLTLAKDPRHNSCLGVPAFFSFLTKLFAEKNVTEYYLLDEFGSFILFDTQECPTWLIVRPLEVIMSDYEYAAEYGAGVEITDILKSRQKLLFIPDEISRDITPDKWLPYLHKATPLVGVADHYYAVFNP